MAGAGARAAVGGGFAGAIFVASLTAAGHRGRISSRSDVRVAQGGCGRSAPRRTRITLVVLACVMVISLILASFDYLISLGIKWLLSY
jgi:hypothetical protein